MTMATGTATAGPGVTPAAALARTYLELVASCEALDVRIASTATEALLDGAELTRSEKALDAFVDAESARIREQHGHAPRRDVAASRALHDYLWSVGLLMSGPWYLERRVPRIAPQDVRIDVAAAAFEIVPGSDFACLPDDPAAGMPGVRVVAHEEALRAELRAAVADHAGPLLAAVGPHARRRPRALWGMAADDLVSGIWYLGRMLDQEDRAIRAATELLPTAVPPFPGGADFRRLAGQDGRRHPTRTRLGCCMYYTFAAAQACSTCPRTCDSERLRRLEDGG
ncbi:(2Fe-2S)-binding protein [Streptomyces sp. PKU-EA00015]|uniref:(2Fe-2S)-binding protein n=1 Tax=Streptomyces sp. PKU-EA00015 TaxID=2748326 RepID=UPI0015A32005|nr:(2Fe-2S)-binding protein [Streptomyces sp. PKU-EA00015]NWF24680.1 (2Fe-2S)-binding protein [Streptomyces sp. PKU-EA00015]